MLKKIMLALALALTLSSCGYSGGFRYPCQDPANWETAECKPPICTSLQICPSDLVKTPQPEGTPNV
jgi:predicted small lipoprotein YifL